MVLLSLTFFQVQKLCISLWLFSRDITHCLNWQNTPKGIEQHLGLLLYRNLESSDGKLRNNVY